MPRVGRYNECPLCMTVDAKQRRTTVFIKCAFIHTELILRVGDFNAGSVKSVNLSCYSFWSHASMQHDVILLCPMCSLSLTFRLVTAQLHTTEVNLVAEAHRRPDVMFKGPLKCKRYKKTHCIKRSFKGIKCLTLNSDDTFEQQQWENINLIICRSGCQQSSQSAVLFLLPSQWAVRTPNLSADWMTRTGGMSAASVQRKRC